MCYLSYNNIENRQNINYISFCIFLFFLCKWFCKLGKFWYPVKYQVASKNTHPSPSTHIHTPFYYYYYCKFFKTKNQKGIFQNHKRLSLMNCLIKKSTLL